MGARKTRRMSRRDFLVGTTAAVASLSAASLLAACGQSTAPAAPATATASKAPSSPVTSAAASAPPVATSTPDAKARTAALHEAAKKEGVLNWYASTSAADAKALIDAFQKTYPGVKVEHYRLSNEELRERIITEFKAGRYEADEIESGWADFHYYQKEGVVQKHDWPAAKSYAKGLVDPNGYYCSSRLVLGAIAYNTKAVSAADAPKSYQDMLDPKWKGKIGIDQDEYEWFLGMLELMGTDKGMEYMRKLAEQKLQLRKGHTEATNLLIAGEFPLHINLYLHNVVEMKIEKKAPVEWVRFMPIIAAPIYHGLTAKAPHPNAAKLFAEWATSEAGQKTYADVGRIPSMTGVKPKYPELSEGVQLFVLTPDLAPKYDAAVEQFRGLFWPKRT